MIDYYNDDVDKLKDLLREAVNIIYTVFAGLEIPDDVRKLINTCEFALLSENERIEMY